jgi:hypothetical protein
MSPAGNVPTSDEGMELLDKLLDGDVMDVLFDPAVGQVGEAVFAMFICGIYIVPLWARTRDVTLPAISLALFSGMIVQVLPGSLVNVAWGVLWISGAIAIFGLIQVFR